MNLFTGMSGYKKGYGGLLIGLLAGFAGLVQAEERSLMELGLGLGAMHQSYYTGTKQQRDLVYPVPVPIYRGKILRADSRGVRAEVLEEDRYKLDISFDFHFAVDSDDVDLRRGMNDIDNQLQTGPSLEINLFQDERNRWQLKLPVRFGIGISGEGMSDHGISFAPQLRYRYRLPVESAPWYAYIGAGPKFGNDQSNDVYYGVATPYATAERPAYEAEAGYAGYRVSLSLRSWNPDRLWVLFARYDNIGGAVFNDSPLVETDDNWSVGILYSHIIYRSKRKVER
ncbi:MipA/OmpV family protein [Halioxenophilus sp. WMMB6]|uniref:MipA/OmpV family protein n=1 Tax=Halioxenophilus sp. WMMB6 TaxID=3073815 RepID=UPI00295F2205|nr:MipA/OmpV family protein [Halioxenophilus sp. WMMB6]